MGCCSSTPKPPQEDDPVYLDPDLDPEESEHAGHVHTAANDKVKLSENHHFKVMDRKPEDNNPVAQSNNSIVMQRIEKSAMSSRKLAFFSGLYKGDPFKIVHFLSDVDLARLSQVNRQLHSVVEGYLSLRHAKKLARPHWEFQDWYKLGMNSRGQGLAWTKLKRQLQKEDRLNIIEEHADDLTMHIFKEKYEAKRLPVIISGCATDWKSFTTSSVWTLDSLATRFGDCLFRFNDLHGEEILLKDYLIYARSTDDDSPLGLYDSQLGVEPNDPRKILLDEYKPPAFFGADLFSLVQDHERPPYRWILIGMPRSGTEMHIDPLETSAWVTLVSGKKKWVMFPPGTDYKALGGVHKAVRRVDSRGSSIADVVEDSPDEDERTPSACEWFLNYWNTPATKVKGLVSFVQGPGETVFVPGGWPHIVINLEETVAITHNYAPKESLDRIRASVAKTEPDFSKVWEEKLHEHSII